MCAQLSACTESDNAWSLSTWLQAAFLPEGYPESCSADYARYQVFDTLQALCSTLVGHMATAGLLRASGVGDAQANVLSSALVWMLSDGVGHISRVLFAWYNSALLDAYAKQFRLLADVANDAVLLLNLLAGSVLRNHFALLLCVSAVLHAVVSVAGAATRAAVVVHQARSGNVSDVAAKDGSQETGVNLVGLLLGLVLVPLVSSSSLLTYTAYALLTSAHMSANWAAVSCLHFATLNPFRFDLLIASYDASNGKRVSPMDVINAGEPILPHSIARHVFGKWRPIRLGVRTVAGGSTGDATIVTPRFIIRGNAAMLHCSADTMDVLHAYFAIRHGTVDATVFARFVELCKGAGWSFERCSLCIDEWRSDW